MAPASAAPPSGEASMPSSVCRSLAAAARSPSVTATAPPPLSRNARSIRRSPSGAGTRSPAAIVWGFGHGAQDSAPASNPFTTGAHPAACTRSEEHTSELQSLAYLVCRLLLEKKKTEQHFERTYGRS